MSTVQPIQLDPVFGYLQAAVQAVSHALRQTHGEAFTSHFMHDYRAVVLLTAKTRLCGCGEDWLSVETLRLRRGLHNG